MANFLQDPALPPPPDLGMIDPGLAAQAPDGLLGLTLDLLVSGDVARGGEYVDLLSERGQRSIRSLSWRPASQPSGRSVTS